MVCILVCEQDGDNVTVRQTTRGQDSIPCISPWEIGVACQHEGDIVAF